MSLISLGNVMASEIRIVGSSVQRDVPRVLFQSVFVNGTHAIGPYHAFSVSANGQRFVIPQFENPQALYAAGTVGRGRGATLTTILGDIVADRHATTAPIANSSSPITVVRNWTAALKQK